MKVKGCRSGTKLVWRGGGADFAVEGGPARRLVGERPFAVVRGVAQRFSVVAPRIIVLGQDQVAGVGGADRFGEVTGFAVGCAIRAAERRVQDDDVGGPGVPDRFHHLHLEVGPRLPGDGGFVGRVEPHVGLVLELVCRLGPRLRGLGDLRGGETAVCEVVPFDHGDEAGLPVSAHQGVEVVGHPGEPVLAVPRLGVVHPPP